MTREIVDGGLNEIKIVERFIKSIYIEMKCFGGQLTK